MCVAFLSIQSSKYISLLMIFFYFAFSETRAESDGLYNNYYQYTVQTHVSLKVIRHIIKSFLIITFSFLKPIFILVLKCRFSTKYKNRRENKKEEQISNWQRKMCRVL